MHRSVRGLFTMAAATAVTALTATLVAIPSTASAAAPAPTASPIPTPSPSPTTYSTQTYPWGPVRTASGLAEAEGRVTMVMDINDPLNKRNGFEVQGVLRHSFPRHMECAHLEFEYRTIYDPLGEWRPIDSYQQCAKGDLGFTLVQWKASGLRYRLSRIHRYHSQVIEPGVWHEVTAVG